jgi:hypothetical protein
LHARKKFRASQHLACNLIEQNEKYILIIFIKVDNMRMRDSASDFFSIWHKWNPYHTYKSIIKIYNNFSRGIVARVLTQEKYHEICFEKLWVSLFDLRICIGYGVLGPRRAILYPQIPSMRCIKQKTRRAKTSTLSGTVQTFVTDGFCFRSESLRTWIIAKKTCFLCNMLQHVFLYKTNTFYT